MCYPLPLSTPLLHSYLHSTSNMITFYPPPIFCFSRPTAGITADGISSRSTTTNPPCRTITHSNVHGPQTDSSRLCEEETQVWSYSFSVHLTDVRVYRMHPFLYRKIFHFPSPHNATQRICSNTSHLRPTGIKTSKNSYSTAVQPPYPTYVLLRFPRRP